MTEKEPCPACGKGREFAKTAAPPKGDRKEGRPRAMRMPRYDSADMNEKLILNLRDISHVMRMLLD